MNEHERKRGIGRRIFFGIRMISLLAILGVAAQLLLWNREADPRFYLFLSTPPGKLLSEMMRWPNLYNKLEHEKPLEDYTDAERAWREQILHMLEETWPTHTLDMADGSERHVRILSGTPDAVHIEESFGPRGSLETRLPRNRIRSITPYAVPPPEVTWRDVRFQMEFPDFDLTYAGHYTVLTDAPYFKVASSVEALEHLRDQYLDLFGSLVRFPRPDQRLQVLFFTREEDYRRHQEKTAPDLASSLGYYSPLEDRMVMFNHQFSRQAEAIRAHMREKLEPLQHRARTPGERKRLRGLQEAIEDEIRDRAHLETLSTLRHEGAHHLGYTYGVHSWIHAENAWLAEGIATYFESPVPGGPVLSYQKTVRDMRDQGRLPSLADLMAVRLPGDFQAQLPRIRPHEAYALSWSLFRFCMEPPRRERFLAYLHELQNPQDPGALMRTPRHERLARALGMTAKELELAWRAGNA